MAFDYPRPHPAAPRPGSSDYADDDALLQAIAHELGSMREKAVIRRTGSGHPFLAACSVVDFRLNVEITTARRDGRVYALWPWGDELPTAPSKAAAAIRRVINPDAS